ncbi:MAG: hypothetical protein ABS81_15425 [Pseudonocardia sp. SCN 72-86]|nr:MAG: hypothetical protein ABS81_15425 [Pseudonocardia sp. SCN 72-86]
MNERTRSRFVRAALVTSVIAVLAAVALVLLVVLRPTATVPGTATAAGGTPTVLAPADVARLENALTTADSAVAGDALAPPVREAYLRQPFPLLPAGSDARIDAGSMVAIDDLATVGVDVGTGAAAGRWQLVLARIDGQWLVVGARRP